MQPRDHITSWEKWSWDPSPGWHHKTAQNSPARAYPLHLCGPFSFVFRLRTPDSSCSSIAAQRRAFVCSFPHFLYPPSQLLSPVSPCLVVSETFSLSCLCSDVAVPSFHGGSAPSDTLQVTTPLHRVNSETIFTFSIFIQKQKNLKKAPLPPPPLLFFLFDFVFTQTFLCWPGSLKLSNPTDPPASSSSVLRLRPVPCT